MINAKKGTKQTEEQKIKRKEATTQTWKRKIEEGFKRKYWKPTEEGKSKISNAQKGKIVSEETRKKLSNALTGKPKTKKHRDNLSKNKKGKPVHTEYSKQLLREHGKKRNLTSLWAASIVANSIPVLQFDSTGNFIKEHPSSSHAEMELKGRIADNIRQTIRHFKKTGVQRKAYGFLWKEK
jgi:hypothetical protein